MNLKCPIKEGGNRPPLFYARVADTTDLIFFAHPLCVLERYLLTRLRRSLARANSVCGLRQCAFTSGHFEQHEKSCADQISTNLRVLPLVEMTKTHYESKHLNYFYNRNRSLSGSIRNKPSRVKKIQAHQKTARQTYKKSYVERTGLEFENHRMFALG